MAACSWKGAAAGLSAATMVFALLAASGWAVAAPADPPLLLAQATSSSDEGVQPGVSSSPDSYTANYGDWQLRCVRNAADPAAPVLACQAVTVVVAEGQQQPFAQIALARGADGTMHLTALVPVNVLVTSRPTIGTDESDPGLPVPWLTCQPGGCAAGVALADADLQHLRAYAGQGRLLFTDSAGNDITVSFSFRGLSQALDALALELGK